MKLHYLEIVTPDVDGVCAAYEGSHAASFGAPDPLLGGARTAQLPDGATLGVRGPLRDTERPIVRPYWLVTDIAGALDAVKAAGGFVALPSMEIPGKGTIAIYIQGGAEHGLWQE